MELENSDGHLTFQQLRKQYAEDELSYFPGDRRLRYQAFAPFFLQLLENKVVYYERFLVIAKLEDIEITPNRFGATAVPLLSVRQIKPPYYVLDEPWQFGGPWEAIRLIGNSLNMLYAGWTLWPEPYRVKAVEQAILKNDLETALSLIIKKVLPNIGDD